MDSTLLIPVVSVILGALIAVIFFGSYFRKRRSEVQTISHPELPSDPKKHQKPSQTKKSHSKPHSHSSDKVCSIPGKLHKATTELSQSCFVLFSAQFRIRLSRLASSSSAKFRSCEYDVVIEFFIDNRLYRECDLIIRFWLRMLIIEMIAI